MPEPFSSLRLDLLVRRVLMPLASGVVVIALSACGASGPTSQATSSGSSTSAPQSASEILNSQCVGCHAAPTEFKAQSADQANQLLDTMMGRGAQITADQKQVLVEYFSGQ
jgi:uncharacterized membrane protein